MLRWAPTEKSSLASTYFLVLKLWGASASGSHTAKPGCVSLKTDAKNTAAPWRSGPGAEDLACSPDVTGSWSGRGVCGRGCVIITWSLTKYHLYFKSVTGEKLLSNQWQKSCKPITLSVNLLFVSTGAGKVLEKLWEVLSQMFFVKILRLYTMCLVHTYFSLPAHKSGHLPTHLPLNLKPFVF